MKTRRLSEIDLAKLASIPPGPLLDKALRAYNAGGGSWSYDPVRSSTSDILGAKTPLHGSLQPLTWEQIESQINRASSRGRDQAVANTEVGKVLFENAKTKNWSAVKFQMDRLPIGFGDAVRYWCDVVLADGEGPFIPFFDHRREYGINATARQIVFSMQHIWVRERHPDLSAARLAVIRFPSLKHARGLVVDFHTEAELLSYDELNERVQNVYAAWARISQEKANERRKTGTGGSNPFDF
jgi:hypothetical protein